MDDDPFFGSHMRTMRQMNNMMNSLFADPFGMGGGMMGAPDPEMFRHHQQYQQALCFPGSPLVGGGGMNPMAQLMPFGAFPSPMQNFNRLIGRSLDSLGGDPDMNSSFHSSSTVVSMTPGPDGRPQVYKATSSTRVAPGGIKETQRTESDSRTGTKRMAIGHHIGDRAHIIEREQNLHSGDREEREDFINIEEEQAEDFNREWEDKTVSGSGRVTGGGQQQLRITAGGGGGGGGGAQRNRHSYGGGSGVYTGAPLQQQAITAGPSRRNRERHSANSRISPRRTIRASPLALHSTTSPSSMSTARGPYLNPHHSQPSSRKQKNMKTVSGTPPPNE